MPKWHVGRNVDLRGGVRGSQTWASSIVMIEERVGPHPTNANFPYTLAQAFLAVGLEPAGHDTAKLSTAIRTKRCSSAFTSWLVRSTGRATRSEPGMAGPGCRPGRIPLLRLKPEPSLAQRR